MIELLIASAKEVKKDWMIVTPFWVFFFGFQTLSLIASHLFLIDTSPSLTTILSYATVWVLELFIKCIIMTVSQKQSISYALSQTLSQFNKIIITSILILLPVALLLIAIAHNASGNAFQQFILFIGFIVIVIPALLIQQFLPLPYLLESEPLLLGLKKTARLIQNNLLPVIRYILWIFLISLSTLIFSSILKQVPFIGKSILVVGIQGITATIIAIFTAKVYTHILKKSNVTTSA